MTTNYLPFIRIQYVTVPANDRGFLRLPIFSPGGGKRVILDDFQLIIGGGDVEEAIQTPYLMRVGVMGYKYLTEDFHKVSVYHSGSRPLCSCWRLPKPYRIYPGQRMRVIYNKSGYYSADRYAGIMFNAVRERDNRPILLYDTDEVASGSGVSVALNDETLACPHDSPVLIHSVTTPEWANTTYNLGPQIWGPDDRQWIDFDNFVNVAAIAPAFYSFALAPLVSPMPLGEKNGWVLDPSQIFTAEILNQTGTDSNAFAILRGVTEVEE